jgi:hypothetical protein
MNIYICDTLNYVEGREPADANVVSQVLRFWIVRAAFQPTLELLDTRRYSQLDESLLSYLGRF